MTPSAGCWPRPSHEDLCDTQPEGTRRCLKLQVVDALGAEATYELAVDGPLTVAELTARAFRGELAEGARVRCMLRGRQLAEEQELPAELLRRGGGGVLQCWVSPRPAAPPQAAAAVRPAERREEEALPELSFQALYEELLLLLRELPRRAWWPGGVVKLGVGFACLCSLCALRSGGLFV